MTAVTGGWTAIGTLADLTLGEGRAYVADGKAVAVFRLTDGSLRATDAACPHRGGPLADGQVDRSTVTCPLHQYVFDFDTGACTTGSIPSVTTYSAKVDDDGVISVLVNPES